jgi:D-glycero-D-manno-heptose 1,7-bisphosphate phosphatase
MTPRRFVLLDRDGTITVERNYLSDPDQVELLPQVGAGLRRMTQTGLGLIVVTNQSGIARGFFDEQRLEEIHARMNQLLNAEGVQLDGIYFCPHTPEGDCECRKPRPGMVQRAAADFGFDPKQCFVIGDKPCDIDLGHAVGATTLLVRTGYGAEVESAGQSTAHEIVDDLLAAAAKIEQLLAIGPK